MVTGRISSLLALSLAVCSVWEYSGSPGVAVRAFSFAPATLLAHRHQHATVTHIHHRQLRSKCYVRPKLLSRGSGRVSGGSVVHFMSVAEATGATESADYQRNKEALKKDLRDEYASFFDNFESDRYLPDVQFIDPVTSFVGFDNYKKNLDMLGGRSALGKILFKDAAIVLHGIEEPGPFRLRTRWTLTVCFKALPWQPVPCFTGISEYTVDSQARVVKQEDYWDSVNLVGGRYQAVSAIDGLKDFVGQVLPKVEERASGGLGKQAGVLLRRAKDYEIRFFQAGGAERGASSGVAAAQVVASREFDGEATVEATATNSRILLDSLRIDGLRTDAVLPRLLSPGSQKAHQVCVNLVEHDWPGI